MNYTKKLAIAGAALLACLAIPGTAWAQVGYSGLPPDQVQGTELRRDPSVLGAEVSAEETVSEESESSDSLPVTGGDLLGLTVIGLGAVGAGAVFVRRSRRTT
ncbi:MAG: LPXTG cell wall anchor domain-containing protein [Actinomycetota bacterium]|nr:LPXTG cell wall anchor domain-containing protein [Actinomycetota bacterium]